MSDEGKGPDPTNDTSEERAAAPHPQGEEDDAQEFLPIGAILITSFLALVILLMWFGMFFLDFSRG